MAIEKLAPKQNIFERFPVLKTIPEDRFPKHVFIIPDGNRRYAKRLGEESLSGHEKGIQTTLNLLRSMRELPIDIVTLWGFSSDNWQRPDEEKSGLMTLFEGNIELNLPELIGQDARFVHLGRKDRIPSWLAETLRNAEEKTKNNNGQTVCVAIDFGGKDHEERVAKDLFSLGVMIGRQNSQLPIDQISAIANRDLLNILYDTHGTIPPADLIIRTSEQRTSDVGWINGTQTELFFLPDKFFPELNEKDIVNAMVYFAKRERRLGK